MPFSSRIPNSRLQCASVLESGLGKPGFIIIKWLVYIPLSAEFSPNLLNKDELVVYYSLLTYSCKDIQQLLQYVHGHVIR